MIKLAKVRGESMAPTLAPGDYMIITKARSLSPGFVVLVDHPKYGVIVKRIARLENEGVILKGDGPESRSSEDMGEISHADIIGRVRLAITPNGLKRV